MIFDPAKQFGDYVIVRHKRELRRKSKRLARSLVSFVPAEYMSQVKWITTQGSLRSRDPYGRYYGILAWKIGPLTQ